MSYSAIEKIALQACSSGILPKPYYELARVDSACRLGLPCRISPDHVDVVNTGDAVSAVVLPDSWDPFLSWVSAVSSGCRRAAADCKMQVHIHNKSQQTTVM